MTGCSIAAKRMGNDLVTGKKNIQDISKAMNTASWSTKALGVAMNVMANVGFMLAITAITKIISELAQAQDNAVQAAKEATETYRSELDSITDYKQRLSELHEELKSGNLSYEETKTKRTELMTIQDELIKKFGTEKGVIESVTKAVKGQVDALDNLNEKAYRDWIAKADEQTFWSKLLPGGKSGLDQAIDYMETKKTVSFMDMQNANLSDDLQEIQKEIDETIQAKYNLDKTFAMFNVTGTPDELRTQLENIRQDYIDISEKVFKAHDIYGHGLWGEYRKETIDSINEAIANLDKGLEEHQDTYRTYIEGLIKYDSEYSDEYANILQKRAELESAQNSGNAEEIKTAKQEFMDSINDAIIVSDSDESIKKYFESIYPELQAEFDKWKFEFDLETNKDSINDIAKEIGEKYTATDLLNMVDTEGVQEGEESFNSLIDKAIEYGICTDKSAAEVQKLIDLLVELGIVQDNVKGDTFNDEDPISFSDIFSLESADNTLTTFGKISESIDTIQNAYKTLSDAIDEYNEEGAFSIDTLQSVIALGGNWLDYLVDEDGALKLDKESLEQLTQARLNDMRVQAINNVIDNVSKIESDAQANDYLKTTNYALAESYEEVAEKALESARAKMQDAVAAGDLSQANMDAAMNKAKTDIAKINKLFANTGINTKSITGKSSSSSSSTDDFKEQFDFFERRVKVLDNAVTQLKANLENLTGSFAKNQLLDQNSNILEERIRNYSDAAKMYQEKAQESLSRLDAETQKKIVNGSVSLNDYIGEDGKAVTQAMNDYKGWADKVAECTEELANLETQLRQLELDKFNHIVQDFTDQFDLRDSAKGLIDKQISLFEEAGQLIGKAFYEEQIGQTQKQLSLLENEKAQLVNQLNSALGSGRIQRGTEEWLEMVNALSTVDGNILDCKKSIEEFDNAIQDLHWETFDRVQDTFGNISDEISNLLDMMKNSEVATPDNQWTAEGLTQLGLYAQQYELATYQVSQYADEINRLNADYLMGKYSATEYADKLADLRATQWKAVNASESAKMYGSKRVVYKNKAIV